MAKVTRTNFTAPKVEKAQCEPGKQQTFLWDSTAPGLALRITSAGSKAYVFQSRVNGRALRITIGDVRAWSLGAAQTEARRLQTLCDSGTDPREQKAELAAQAEAKRKNSEHSAEPALTAWEEYCADRAPRWGAAHKADHKTVSKEGGQPRTRGRRKGESATTQPGILRPLLVLPLAQIDATRVRLWLKDEAAKRPTHARLALGLLRAFLNWCANCPEYQAYAHADACTARLARDELPKKAAKNDCLQREQLPAWFSNVQAIRNPVIAGYLQVALLSGARREEIAGLRWEEDVDFTWYTLTIRDKVEGQRTIPMTPYVAHLLRNLKARSEVRPPAPRRLRQSGAPIPAWEPSPWVFYSPAAQSGRLQEPRIQHNKACAAAGIEGMTIHGLRRSFGTLAEWVECPAGVVAQIQGHKPSATAEKHYRRPIDLLRVWHTKIENWILEQAGIAFVADEPANHLRTISST